MNITIIGAENLRWSGGDPPYAEVSIVLGPLERPSVMEVRESPIADSEPTTVKGMPGLNCYWIGGRGAVLRLQTPLTGSDTTGIRLRFRLLNRLRLQKHLVGEVQVAIDSLHNGAIELKLKKSKEAKNLDAGMLRISFDRGGAGPSSRLSPQAPQQPTSKKIDMSTLVRMFPQCDPSLIQDVLSSFGGDGDATVAALRGMTGDEGARDQTRSKQEKLEHKFSMLQLETVKRILNACGGDEHRATAALTCVANIRRMFPATDEASTIATLEACRFSEQEAAQTLRAAAVLTEKTDAVLKHFPNHDREMVLDVLEAVDYNVGEATLMLSSPEYAPKAPIDTLSNQYPTFDRMILQDILMTCDNNLDVARRTIEALNSAPNPSDIVTDSTPLYVGKSFSVVSPAPTRRCLVFLDDSGSMIGGNLRRGHAIINSVSQAFSSIPTKVVIFGSKNKVRIASDWDEVTDFRRVMSDWEGQSGRTYLWGCVTQFVQIEPTAQLHILLITDGEDTESPPPYRGMQGMVPAVKRLNELGFEGEISLVALGNDITHEIGNQYMALVGATGGAGAVLNDFSEDSDSNWTDQFFQTVTIRGGTADNERENRLRDYAHLVRSGKKQLVPTKALALVDSYLVEVEAAESKLSRSSSGGEPQPFLGSVAGSVKGPIDLQKRRQLQDAAQNLELEFAAKRAAEEKEALDRAAKNAAEEKAANERAELLRRQEEEQKRKLEELARAHAEQEKLRQQKQKEEAERAAAAEMERKRQEEEMLRKKQMEEARRLEEERKHKEEMERLQRMQQEHMMQLAQQKAEEEKLRQLRQQQEEERRLLEEQHAREEQERQAKIKAEEERLLRLKRERELEERRLLELREAERLREETETKRREEELKMAEMKMKEAEQMRIEAERKREQEGLLEAERVIRMKAAAAEQRALEARENAQREERQRREAAAARRASLDTSAEREDFSALHLKHIDGQVRRDVHGNIILDSDLQNAFDRDRLAAIQEAERQRELKLGESREAALTPELRRLLEKRRRNL